MKKFILGFLVGALLFSAMPIYAAVQQFVLYKTDYKVLFNGKEYTDNDYPALSYKGKTYIPIRTLIDAFNLNLDMSINKTIDITKPLGEWINIEEYNVKFTDLPFVKSTKEGNIFSVKSANHTYSFKYENNIWYVKVIE